MPIRIIDQEVKKTTLSFVVVVVVVVVNLTKERMVLLHK